MKTNKEIKELRKENNHLMWVLIVLGIFVLGYVMSDSTEDKKLQDKINSCQEKIELKFVGECTYIINTPFGYDDEARFSSTREECEDYLENKNITDSGKGWYSYAGGFWCRDSWGCVLIQ